MPWIDRFYGMPCPVCGGVLDAPGVCLACREALVPERVGQAVYLGRYRRLRGLVRAVKFRRSRLVLAWAAGRLADRVRSAGFRVDAVTFVPTFPWRALLRGLYPPAELARGIAGELEVPFLALLYRRGYTPSQTQRRNRHRLPQVFAARRPSPPSVLLVDDVLTTGATFRRAAEALFSAGAERVYGAFLAVANPDRLLRLPYNSGGAGR